ncbi:hypothetical protein QT355_00760 [Lactococcus lactis]|uniref:hypothetical protein n=1 Tax=Lactococcus lactis TaxID=1358 RepID=UPI0028772301|nr:hypothetical protein [Lactococcus lactis]MDS1011858.1 hypothetical protein [Lactococcus lactis]
MVVQILLKLARNWNSITRCIPFYIPDLANVEMAKVYIYIGQYTQSNKFMTNLYMRNISCRKDNIQKWEDIPNRYAKHSKFSIDSYYGTISIDGVSSANEKINGAKFLVFPPGESERILITFKLGNYCFRS